MKQIAITLLLCILLHHVVEAQGEKTITVSNVEEFLNAIGKDRTIIMKTGDYVLIEKSDMKGEYYEFADAYDGKELLIHDVNNLNIMGSDDLTTHLITSPNYGHVIRFKNVNGLKDRKYQSGSWAGKRILYWRCFRFRTANACGYRKLQLIWKRNLWP